MYTGCDVLILSIMLQAAVPPAGPYGKTIDGSRQAPALQHQGHESHGGTSAWGVCIFLFALNCLSVLVSEMN